VRKEKGKQGGANNSNRTATIQREGEVIDCCMLLPVVSNRPLLAMQLVLECLKELEKLMVCGQEEETGESM
jgi:hypothetical protein